MAIGANAVVSTAPEERTADAGAIQESAFALGGGTGIAVLGVLAIHSGTETALGLSAFFYTLFIIGASLVILSTTRRRHRRTPQLRAL